jgi:hypothetical protein
LSNRIIFILALCGLVASASAQSNPSFFTYNIGGGPGIGKDDVASYVGNSYQFVAGGGANLSKLFGANVEYMYYGLGFRDGVKLSQSLTNQSGNMQSISVDGIFNVPKHLGKLSAYGIFGVGFYWRSVSVPARTLGPGTVYQPAWRWWDIERDIFNNPIPGQVMSSNTKVAGGFNFGGGITYPLNHLHNSKFYIEWRYHRAYQSDGQTIVMPVTLGLRW